MFLLSRKQRICLFLGFLLMSVALCSCVSDYESELDEKHNNYSMSYIEHNLQEQLDLSLENGYGITADETKNIVHLHSIYYGCFTQTERKEILAVFRFSNPPHIAGMERSIVAIYDFESLELIVQRLFTADDVELHIMSTYLGQDLILLIGETVYQSKATQNIELLSVIDGNWVEVTIDFKEWDDEFRCALVGGSDLFIFYQPYDISTNENLPFIVSLLKWDAHKGEFVKELNYG